jgi:hypothetical protein
MREVIVDEISANEYRIDQREPGFGSVAHRDRGRAIELDYRRRIGPQ